MIARFATSEVISGRIEFSVAIGVGIALIPQNICRAALADGHLSQVLPAWHSHDSIVHMVFTTRRGLLPATRALINYVADHLPSRL
jgi:DNA-binding transcriptional LysR family regulator